MESLYLDVDWWMGRRRIQDIFVPVVFWLCVRWLPHDAAWWLTRHTPHRISRLRLIARLNRSGCFPWSSVERRHRSKKPPAPPEAVKEGMGSENPV